MNKMKTIDKINLSTMIDQVPGRTEPYRMFLTISIPFMRHIVLQLIEGQMTLA